MRKIYQLFKDKPLHKGLILNSKYEILNIIGTGSYGIVYLCKELHTNERRIIKQLRPSKRRKDTNLFGREMAILETLHHTNIPKFIESFFYKEHFMYVMEFINGENLEELIFHRKKVFNELESLLLLNQLLELVAYLHENHIYHFDLRIPNLLLKNNEVYIIDFGLSRLVTNEDDPIEVSKMKYQDYYDLGEILLFLLYTTYPSNRKKALPWTEELSLKLETVNLIKSLFGLQKPYETIADISIDIKKAINAQVRSN
ncbi:protein kinase domain-containing protein [Lederbergia graminis]|uniref:Protein kinase n=1 Tax=Lederbergia graminis TaxID=735518 RepID=A0ABW0LF43_9BACI